MGAGGHADHPHHPQQRDHQEPPHLPLPPRREQVVPPPQRGPGERPRLVHVPGDTPHDIRDTIRDMVRDTIRDQINTDPMVHRSGYVQVVVPPSIVQSGQSHDMVVR